MPKGGTMTFKRFTNFTILLLILFAFPTLRAQVTAIKAGKLIDPATGTTQTNVTILVEGKKIKSVGTDISIPAGAEVIDLPSMTVLPGLIDCHTHLCEMIRVKDDPEYGFKVHYVDKTTVDRALDGVAAAYSFLEHGFTTVRDVGNSGEFADISLRNALRRDLFPGPTMITTGKIIAPFGGQFHANADNLEHALVDYFFADTHDEILKAIRTNLHLGADWIKIVVDDQRYIYSEEDIRFIVDECTKAGVKVAAHTVTEQGAINAIKGGVASIEHAFTLSDEGLKLAKEKGTFLVGTDFPKIAWDLYRAPMMYPLVVDRLKRAYAIGTPMAFGSDLVIEVPGYSRGAATLEFLNTWVEAEIPNDYILKAMTTFAAELLDLTGKRGIIQDGAYADIIATTENPLDDILALKNVGFVMKNGKVFKNSKK